MVRLKVYRKDDQLGEYYGFNSSMVRLKAQLNALDNPADPGFNSSMVRLKAQHGCPHHYIKASFNSSMVRLKEGAK